MNTSRRSVRFCHHIVFLIIATAAFRLAATDVDTYLVAKAKTYIQTSTNAPSPGAGDPPPILFHCDVDGKWNTNGGTLISATITPPGKATQTLVNDSGQTYADSLDFDAGFMTEADLNAAYPTGTYTLNVNTRNDGAKTLNLSFPTGTFPNRPRISNYTAAQAINPNSTFRLSWDSLAGTADRIGIEIRTTGVDDDEVYARGVFDSDFLPGTATYLDIPAYTLAPGATYSIEFIAAKVTSQVTNAYPGASGFTGYAALLNTQIRTSGNPDTTPPTLVSSSLNNGLLTLLFSERMNTNNNWSISWSYSAGSLNTSNYRWGADGRTFYVNVSGAPGMTFRAILNPSGYSASFEDISGNQLPVNTASAYLTLISASVSPSQYALVNTALRCISNPTNVLYQWQRNGTNILGATAATLVPNIPASYRAIAKSGASSYTTLPVTVLATNQTVPIYLRYTNGANVVWYFYRTNYLTSAAIRSIEPAWQMAAQADFNRDGQTDFLWQKSTNLMIWTMNGTTFLRSNTVNYKPVAGALIANSKDFNGDGHSDFLQHNPLNNSVSLVKMFNGTNSLGATAIRNAGAGWRAMAVGDFASDRSNDLIWQNTVGTNRLAVAWYGTNFMYNSFMFGGSAVPTGWNICGAADFTADGQKDLLLQSNSGQIAIWVMNRTAFVRTVLPRGSYAPVGWKVVGPK